MYGEILIAVNMLFNYAILSFANKVGNIQVARGRLWLASFLGAVVVVIFPSSLIVVVVGFLAMTVCAFGVQFNLWKKSASLVLIGAVVAGGLLTALQLRLQLFGTAGNVLICVLIAYVSLTFLKQKWLDVRVAHNVSSLHLNSTLSCWNAEVDINVFIDSGNSCTEPLSGSPVHFVSFKIVEPFLPANLINPLLEWNPSGSPNLAQFPDEHKKNIRLIRLMTVQGSSWAVGFKFEQWKLDNGEMLRPGYLVLTKNDRRYPEGAGAILHVSAMDSLLTEGRIVHAT
jgi:stage II sporulation protein GA (sporulation sigma-E factor processing peptidase)